MESLEAIWERAVSELKVEGSERVASTEVGAFVGAGVGAVVVVGASVVVSPGAKVLVDVDGPEDVVELDC